MFNTAGMAAVTFATGAYAAWGSTFYQRVHGLTATEAGKWIGLLLVVAGLIGIVLGMFLPDLLHKLTKRAYLLLRRIRRPGRDSAGRRRHPRPALRVIARASCSGRRSCCRWCSGRATR